MTTSLVLYYIIKLTLFKFSYEHSEFRIFKQCMLNPYFSSEYTFIIVFYMEMIVINKSFKNVTFPLKLAILTSRFKWDDNIKIVLLD